MQPIHRRKDLEVSRRFVVNALKLTHYSSKAQINHSAHSLCVGQSIKIRHNVTNIGVRQNITVQTRVQNFCKMRNINTKKHRRNCEVLITFLHR